MSSPDGPKPDRAEPREWPRASSDLCHELQLMGSVSQLSPWRRRGGIPSRLRGQVSVLAVQTSHRSHDMIPTMAPKVIRSMNQRMEQPLPNPCTSSCDLHMRPNFELGDRVRSVSDSA